MHRLFLVLSLFAISAHAQQPARSEAAQSTTVCELLADPASWNHKLVKVTGFASHGFEDSGFSSPECDSRHSGLWMSYGGTRQTGTMSTVNEYNPTRAQPLKVEGIDIPLVDDAIFQHFDTALHAPSRTGTQVHATVIARFFSGEVMHYPNGQQRWGGYGHLGCCSLFVVQQVLAVDENHDPALDVSDAPDQPNWKTYRFLETASGASVIKAQKLAESDVSSSAWSDPHRVALEALLDYAKNADPKSAKLHRLSSTLVRQIYEGSVSGTRTRYRIIVSRPNWLSFYAADPHKVIWTVIGAFSTE